MQLCFSRISEVAGFALPLDVRRSFDRFHNFITNPQPAYITRWRAQNTTEHLYHQHVGGIGNVHNGLAAAHYHAREMDRIAAAVEKIVQETEVIRQLAPLHSMAGGNTLLFDFHYQAFMFAARRTLEYLTFALLAYFKQKSHRYGVWSSIIEGNRNSTVAAALFSAYERSIPRVKGLLSDEHNKAARDIIAHEQALSGGTLNISGNGVTFSCEEEHAPRTAMRLAGLSECVRDFLSSFETAVRALPE